MDSARSINYAFICGALKGNITLALNLLKSDRLKDAIDVLEKADASAKEAESEYREEQANFDFSKFYNRCLPGRHCHVVLEKDVDKSDICPAICAICLKQLGQYCPVGERHICSSWIGGYCTACGNHDEL